MKLYFRQKIFSWLDSYDVYDESGDIYFKVKGKIAWGHKLAIYDASGAEVGVVKEQIVDIMPHFDFYMGRTKVGTLKKKLTLLRPKFSIDFGGRKWEIDGNWWEWDYLIKEGREKVAAIYKRVFRLTDNYVIEVRDPEDALGALMVVIAIDAEKCSEEKKADKKAAKKEK